MTYETVSSQGARRRSGTIGGWLSAGRGWIVRLAAAALMWTGAVAARGQVAVKTNVLYDATATINIGIEVGLSSRWTLDLSGDLNAWEFSHGRRWKHWFLQPEGRYWLCDRFSGSFIAMHLHGGQFNIGNLDNGIDFFGSDFGELSDRRVQGWFLGAGVGYGYAWVLGRHWNIEAEIAIGYAYARYDKYDCESCDEKIADDKDHHYVGPTKAAINLIYVF